MAVSIETINALLQDVKDAAVLAKEIKAEARITIATWVSEVRGEERTQRFNDVYWQTETPITIIGEMCGLTVIEVKKFIQPHPSGVHCDGCGISLLASSREGRRDLQSYHKRGRRFSFPSLCADCKAIKNDNDRVATLARNETEDAATEKLKNMPYNDYLKTAHWKRVRTAALHRSSFRCQLCNRKRQLHVHHRTYERRGHEYYTDVIALCDECHAKYHDKEVSK